MKNILYLSLLILVSCKTYKVPVPGSLASNVDKLHVKGTSVSVFGHKIKVEGFGEGRMYSGFTASSGTEKRLFPLYFDLDRRLNYISNHFAKEINKSKTKFNFEFSFNDIYANTYCIARTSETSLSVKQADFNIGLSEDYSFDGLIFTNKITTPWKISFSGSENIKNGFHDVLGNVRNTNGLLTNDTVQIDIKLINYNDLRQQANVAKTPFNIPVGYEFVLNGRLLGFVDVFDKNIYISRTADDHTRIILISAATSILVKTNA